MKKLIFMIPLFFVSCVEKDISSILIQNNKSSDINLFEGEYAVHFMEKQDSIFSFPISDEEISEVKKTYEKQNIKNYEKETLVTDDKPLIMPATDIKYIINFTDGSKQIFIIRTDFRKNPLDVEKYENLKKFIEKIDKTIKSKKEIQNTSKSDFLHL